MSVIGGPRLSTIPPTFFNDYSFDFDGTDDYIETTLKESGDITLSAWINCDGTYTIWQPRYPLSITPSHSSLPNATLGRIYMRSTNFNVMLQIYDDAGANFNNYYVDVDLDGAGWKHCVWTFNNTTKHIYFYLDGVRQDWTKWGGTPSDVPYLTATGYVYDSFLKMGTRAGSYFFDGKVDEVSVWDSVLSSSNISTIYNSGTPNNLTSLNPVAWYRMGDNGSYKSPQWLLPSNENKDKFSNYSMSFDGTDDYVSTSTIFSVLDGQTNATFSMWVNPDNITGHYGLFSTIRNGTSSNFQIYAQIDNVGRIRIFGDDTGDYVYSNTGVITAGAWNHICFTIDLTQALADRVVIYVNGVDETITKNYQITAFSTSTDSLYIGENQNGYLSPMRGVIDDFALWTTTLDSNTVTSIYNLGEPNDLTLSTSYTNGGGVDKSGGLKNYYRLGENATFKSPQWLIPNNENKDKASNYSMSFDGTDDYITLGTSSNLKPPNVSFSAWYYPEAVGTKGAIISSGNKTGGWSPYSINHWTTDKLCLLMTTSTLNQVFSTATLPSM